MAKGVNLVVLVGNLGNEPDVKYSPNGGAIANISLATSETWKDKNTGEQKEKTEWHRVVFFRRLAEIAAEYLHKGSKVYIRGKLQTRKWQDSNGQDRYTTEIVAEELQMLDSKGQQTQNAGNSYAEAQQQNAVSEQQQQDMGHVDPDFNDDLPF